MTDNGWSQHKIDVLHRLDACQTSIADMEKTQTKILEAVAGLRVKAGVWGVMGGVIPVAVGLVLWFIKANV